MKTKARLTYGQIALIAVTTELLLIAIQFGYFKVFSSSHQDAVFNTDYMKYRGFYIFQIVGFFIYTALVYLIAEINTQKILNKIITLIIVGGIVELSFYLILTGNYEGVFVFSILDKVIAAAFGVILNSYTTKNVRRPGAFF